MPLGESMTFQPTGLRFAAACAAAGLCVGAATAASDRALVVAAIADDAATVVVRDASGSPVAYRVGQTVRGTPWRVTRIHGGMATLLSAQSFKGSSLELRVRIGQHVPANAVEHDVQAAGTQ